MNREDLEKQCAMYALVAQMNACIAEIEGMKADNENRRQNNESMAYVDGDFGGVATRLDEISKKLEWL
jgi:hypothetical protein